MRKLRVAIVGSEERKWKPEQKRKAKAFIRLILLYYADLGYDVVLVSGRCPKGGVDVWAEQIADELGVEKLIFPPKKHGWYWYRKRNILIARHCDVLYDIEPKGKRSGGTWTLKYAERLGKEVHLIEIS